MRGILSYNENKVREETAECILARGFAAEADLLSFNSKLAKFAWHMSKNTNVKSNSLHISLNFDPKEKLSQEKLRTIASTYIEKIGFAGQPFLVYQHFDAAHPHVHIVTTNIRLDGKRICLKNIGKNQSEKARKEIEVEFGLVKAQGRKVASDLIKPADLTRAIYGKSETKRSISNIVNAVTRSYRFTSIHELNAVLKQFNVIADCGKEGTMIRNKNGLRYSLIDNQGNQVGIPIKASSIFGKPTLSALSEQFELNDILRTQHKARLRDLIDCFNTTGNTFADFLKHLERNQVYPVLRQNEEGRIYGLTFIDNSTKCVFNGSALGKQYSAKGILDRFETKSNLSYNSVPRLPVKEEKVHQDIESIGYTRVAPSAFLDALTEASMDKSGTPYELKRRRKRKGRSI